MESFYKDYEYRPSVFIDTWYFLISLGEGDWFGFEILAVYLPDATLQLHLRI